MLNTANMTLEQLQAALADARRYRNGKEEVYLLQAIADRKNGK